MNYSSSQHEDRVCDVGHVLLLEEVVRLKYVDLFNAVFHQGFLKTASHGPD
jgi:hypothetical protein